MESLEESARNLLSSDQADAEQFHGRYDQFLWLIATAAREELRAFTPKLAFEPFIRLPAPLQVALFRMIGLEYADDANIRDVVLGGISMYCDPVEQDNATATIRCRILPPE